MTNMTFCQGLYELMDSYDGFIMDQWGVLHNGLQPYDGVLDTLHHLKARKKQVVILSNSAKHSADNVERLKKLGIRPGHYKAVVSAGEVTWRGLKEKKDAPFKGLGQNCYLISRPDDKSLLDGLQEGCRETHPDDLRQPGHGHRVRPRACRRPRRGRAPLSRTRRRGALHRQAAQNYFPLLPWLI
jgi:ribonucleotide monophosphatase NagD (HAD superfamily)